MRLVRFAKGSSVASAQLLPSAGVVTSVRHAEQRLDIRERSDGPRDVAEMRGGQTSRPDGHRFETDLAGHVRQRLHPLHVQLSFQLRRRGLRQSGSPLRPDFLGHQPGLRRRFLAVAAARLPPPHATVDVVGHGHPPIHLDAHHRRTPIIAGQEQPARLHRRPAQPPGRQREPSGADGPGRQGASKTAGLEPRPLRIGRLSWRPFGHRQSVDESCRRTLFQSPSHGQHPRRNQTSDGRQRSTGRPRRPTQHALHRIGHFRNVETLLVAHRSPRRHAGHIRCR